MGKVTVQKYTTESPLEMIGYEAGVCWGSNLEDRKANVKRGLSCLRDNHGRTFEFPQVYLTIEGYSARCMRELYTHIAGGPSRLQASTRYIEYGEFDYITPKSIAENDSAKFVYDDVMKDISFAYKQLQDLGVPKEDIANVLPLGMESKMVLRTNLRHLIDIMTTRQCNRAYWEIRDMMRDIKKALCDYSDEWKYICDHYMPIKCEVLGYCPESHGCGMMPGKE